jgi:UDP-N-acetylglucosamine--N-acetylmuramyl-(pentapeptide) pyrophosphoryl-undecaprenol N-acetylglucosamine transferase
MVPDREAKTRLVDMLIDLANNKAEQEILKQNIGRLAVTNADETIAVEILKVLHG